MKRREKSNACEGRSPQGSCIAIAAVVFASASIANAQWRDVWRTQTDGGQNLTEVDVDVQIDSQGNAVTLGWVVDPATDYDLLLRKYDRTGRLLWTRTFDGTGSGYDGFFNVVIDSNDNILTSGTSYNTNGDSDIATLKYAPDGQLLWVQTYDGPMGGRDESYGVPSIGLDSSGNSYVCGYSQAVDGVYEFVTIKYDPAGNEQWVRRHRGPNATYPNSYGWTLSVAPNGNAYVGGDSFNLDDNLDFTVLKYDADGTLIWERMFDSAFHGGESMYTLVIDAAENVFAVGISDSQYLNNDFEYCAVKYLSDGTFQWEGRYGGNFGFHYGWVADTDEVGGVYVSGASMTSGGQYDIATVHFDTNGATDWAQRYSNPEWFGDDWGYYVKRDADGNVLVTGYGWNGHSEGNNAYLLKYSPSGQLLDEINYDGELHADDWWFAADVDDAGRVVVAGYTIGLGTGADSYVAKYSTAPAPALTISPDPLVAGQNATFTATDFEPNSNCYLVYSRLGTNDLFVPFLNVNLGVRNPIQIGSVAVSDAAGTAVWNLHIPGSAAGLNVWLQAAQYNQVTDVLATQVQ